MEEGLGFRLVFLVRRRGEESALEPLRLVMHLHDDEAIDVLRILELFRRGELRLLQDPVVAAFLLSLLRTEEVPAPEEWDHELGFDRIEVAIRREGAVRDEDRVLRPQLVLDLLRQNVAELVEDDSLVDRAADHAAFLVAHGTKVPRIRCLPALLTYDQGSEAFLRGPIANVEGRVGTDRRDADRRGIVALEDLHDCLAVDHVRTDAVPM